MKTPVLHPALATLVSNRPLPPRDRTKKREFAVTECPYCESTNVMRTSNQTTLVGGGKDNEDPNHHWQQHTCRHCGAEFTKEFMGSNVWYTAGGG